MKIIQFIVIAILFLGIVGCTKKSSDSNTSDDQNAQQSTSSNNNGGDEETDTGALTSEALNIVSVTLQTMNPTTLSEVVYRVTFDKPVTNIDVNDFVLEVSGNVTLVQLSPV